jgi:hypothetical protein
MRRTITIMLRKYIGSPSNSNEPKDYTCTSTARSIPGEEEVETPSKNSISSGMLLQVQLPLDVTPSSRNLAQLPTTQLVGIIRASIEKLDQRIQ